MMIIWRNPQHRLHPIRPLNKLSSLWTIYGRAARSIVPLRAKANIIYPIPEKPVSPACGRAWGKHRHYTITNIIH
jgi:hypothetical protein